MIGPACTSCIMQSTYDYASPMISVTLLDLLQGPFCLKCLSPLVCSNCECMHLMQQRLYSDLIIKLTCQPMTPFSSCPRRVMAHHITAH